MARVKPKIKPSTVNKSQVPSRLSSQSPSMPGRTISRATVMARDAAAVALAIGERLSFGAVTGTPSPQVVKWDGRKILRCYFKTR
jgi:hypothetical protein